MRTGRSFYRGCMADTGPPLSAVEVETAEGIWVLIYGPGPGFPVLDITFVLAALVDEES